MVLLALCLMLVSCGGKPGTINGSWAATLSGTETVNGDIPITIGFTVTLNQTSPPDVDATNFTITAAPNSCFTGATLSATFSGGAFTLKIATAPGPFQNVLNLQGNLDGSTIKGSWTSLGGASELECTASGTYKMTKS